MTTPDLLVIDESPPRAGANLLRFKMRLFKGTFTNDITGYLNTFPTALKTQPYMKVVNADDFRVVMPWRLPKVIIFDHHISDTIDTIMQYYAMM